EELTARRPAGGVVGVDVRHIDELLDDIVEPRARAPQDGLEALEGALGLRAHPARDDLAVLPPAREPGGDQHPRGVDADPRHEAPTTFHWALGEHLSTIHRVLLRE